MTPVTPVFPGIELSVTAYAKYQPEYIPLPCWKDPDGRVVTRWKLTWKERLQVIFGGSIWLQLLTFNKPLQPVKLTAEPPYEEIEGAVSA